MLTPRRGLGLLVVLLAVVAVPANDTRDATRPLPALGDLNGDGRDDVLLRRGDGRWHYYAMNGSRYISSSSGRANLTPNTDWQVAGIGDLNGDGRDDVLLRRGDGRWHYYAMNGSRYISSSSGRANLTPNTDWQVAGIGDLNGDGRDDVLLRRGDGRWHYYAMNGSRYISSNSGRANLTPNTDWQVAGIGDLNGDGRDDVLLRRGDGRWHYYAMNGSRYISSSSGRANLTPNTDWQVAGIGDLNGDGRDDVLLRRGDGRWHYYAMNGSRYISSNSGRANLTPNTDWQVAGIGDLNGDGRDDVLLRRGDGRWHYYAMNGSRYISSNSGRANLTPNTDWMIPSAGSNGGMGVGRSGDDGRDTGAPDLTLEHNNTAGPLVVTAGESFFYQVGVLNQGSVPSGPTTLRYYRSSDSTISSSDTQVRTDSIRGLQAGELLAVSLGLSAPSTAGTYYYGSCVDAVSSESNTRNNCSDGIRVTVSSDDTGGGGTGGDDDHSNTRSGATSLSPNSSRAGRIDPGNDTDYFAVQLSESGTLTVYTTGSLDTTGQLLSSSGSSLGSDDDGGSGTNFRIEREVSAGTYYIKVESYRTNTGSYTLHADFRGGGGGASVLRASGGSACSDTIHLRFFEDRDDVTSSSAQWPGGGRVYVLNNGERYQQSLSCTPGYKVCYGARNTRTNSYWGVDIDASKGCSDCCQTCPASGSRDWNLGNLRCDGGDDGGGSGGDPVLVFRVEDACNDGYDLQYRFFEQFSGGSLTGRRIPGDGSVYVTGSFGQSHSHRLNCSSSAGYCLGANRRGINETRYWGVGIDGDQSCTDCCYSCPTSGERTVGRRLVCQ